MNIVCRLHAWWNRDEILIREWEARTGQHWLREGYVKKGGQNGPPRGERPAPPQSQHRVSGILFLGMVPLKPDESPDPNSPASGFRCETVKEAVARLGYDPRKT